MENGIHEIDFEVMQIPNHFQRDPILLSICKILFQYANDAGLNGCKLSDLFFLFPDDREFPDDNPIEKSTFIFCKRHLTQEEWDTYNEYQTKKNPHAS